MLVVMNPETGEVVTADDAAGMSTEQALRMIASVGMVRRELATIQDALTVRLERARREGEVDGSSGELDGVRWKRSAGTSWNARETSAVLDSLVERGLLGEAVATAACPWVESRKPDGRRLPAVVQEVAATDLRAAQELQACNQPRPRWSAEVTA